MQWIAEGNTYDSIRKDTDNNPRYGVAVDQLQSAQPGLVPQLSGKPVSAHIWSSQVMVNHFSDLTYVHLMRSTNQKENLA